MSGETKNTRKRGDKLTGSIYNAVVRLIDEVGYVNLTFQQIAKEAETSRTVLYRRWPTKFDLLRELIDDRTERAFGGRFIDNMEDTGTLRGDLLSFLTLYQKMFNEIGPSILNAYLFEVGQDRERISEEHSEITRNNIQAARILLENASARGEKIKSVSDGTLILPFNLIRMEYIMNNRGFETERLEVLVDEILIPVFSA